MLQITIGTFKWDFLDLEHCNMVPTFKCSAIPGGKYPMSVKPSLHEFSLVSWTVRKPHHSKAIWQAFIKLAFKGSSIGSLQVAFATSHPIFIKVPDVSRAVVESIRAALARGLFDS